MNCAMKAALDSGDVLLDLGDISRTACCFDDFVLDLDFDESRAVHSGHLRIALLC